MKNKSNTERSFWIPRMKLYLTMWVVLLCLSNTIDMKIFCHSVCTIVFEVEK